jgi:hypothetical protein
MEVMSDYSFRTFIGIWILLLIAGALSLQEQHAINVRCNTPYASQIENLSQLIDQFREVIWRVSNCQKKAPATDRR